MSPRLYLHYVHRFCTTYHNGRFYEYDLSVDDLSVDDLSVGDLLIDYTDSAQHIITAGFMSMIYL